MVAMVTLDIIFLVFVCLDKVPKI